MRNIITDMKAFNFKNISILFIFIFSIIILLRFLYPFSLIYFIIPLLIYSFILFLGAKNVCSQFYMKVICKSENKSKIHLTFDDGPDPIITPQILNILKKTFDKYDELHILSCDYLICIIDLFFYSVSVYCTL